MLYYKCINKKRGRQQNDQIKIDKVDAACQEQADILYTILI